MLKFTNQAVRLAVLKNKRQHMPSPTSEEKDAGFSRFIINEDLTPQCFNTLKALQSQEEVAKAWSVDGRIKFMLKDSTVIHRVKSVYDPVNIIVAKASG